MGQAIRYEHITAICTKHWMYNTLFTVVDVLYLVVDLFPVCVLGCVTGVLSKYSECGISKRNLGQFLSSFAFLLLFNLLKIIHFEILLVPNKSNMSAFFFSDMESLS